MSTWQTQTFGQRVQAGVAAGVLSLLALGGLSLYVMSEANASLAEASRLDGQGKHTTGVITGGHIGGSKTTVYYLTVQFQVGGRTYTHVSPVSRKDYDRTPRGSQTGVLYLPADPNICRLEVSIGPAMATNKLGYAYLLMLAALGFPVGIAFVLWWTRRRDLLLAES